MELKVWERQHLKSSEQGATVVIADLDFEVACIVADNIQKEGGQARAYNQVDVTNQSTIKATVDQAIEEFDRIDILVNCAGGTFGANGSSENINMNDWDRTMKLNLNGTLNPIMEILPYMKKQKYGKIVNFSSMGAFNAYTVVLHYHALSMLAAAWVTSYPIILPSYHLMKINRLINDRFG
ncbi:SDR family NAD(P)-dependent oxidoreductase [Neobacillus drentensis]|uniref:SDR family NAD(P)-dependent oxidoreductase n=1 Tax=Neobacillus drentensis TaxID=220684 RepID=UPI0028659AC9|nr:SDR family NAD(P)-dependent oxidoreductase [Neobacillus drentensis]MDR7236336.1 NADP-dependent 3-hydroxy acid dehydrogenase YdfG [Neobacillus drentensis]